MVDETADIDRVGTANTETPEEKKEVAIVVGPFIIIERLPLTHDKDLCTMADDKLRWQKVASEPGPDLPLFQVRFDQMRHPRSEVDFVRVVLEAPDWITVVAITDDGDIVMVEQYRFGVEDLTLEPIGGIVDEGEAPIDAAKRELLEETGFGDGEWRSLGVVQANPAIHNNLCHLFCANGVRQVQEQQLDPGEAIKVHLMSIDDVRNAIADGRFLHPLGQAAMSRVYQLWQSEAPHVST